MYFSSHPEFNFYFLHNIYTSPLDFRRELISLTGLNLQTRLEDASSDERGKLATLPIATFVEVGFGGQVSRHHFIVFLRKAIAFRKDCTEQT